MPPEITEQGGEHHTIDMANNDIYRVPAFMADMRKGAFTPKLISFGPFHHKDPHLQPMENHKYRALHHFLKRQGKPRQYYLDALRNVEHKLRACYDWNHVSEAPESAEFLEMMLLDGCFFTAGYDQNDPIPSKNGAIYACHLYYDMIMIENQIPLLVLQTLLGDVPFIFINQLVLHLFEKSQLEQFGSPIVELPDLGLHVLDDEEEEPVAEVWSRLRHWMRRSPGLSCRLQDSEAKNGSHHQQYEGWDFKLPLATDLYEAYETYLLDFKELEQHAQSKTVSTKVCSHVLFMEDLINTAKDVRAASSARKHNNELLGDTTSVVAGVVPLLLTFLQTPYSMLSYHQKEPPHHT
ncbi:hypothetical protein AMTRI_Chr06g193910 [Amborella trichopoda]